MDLGVSSTAHAQQLGGNAVLGVRFDSSPLGNGLAEVVACGTAATVRPPERPSDAPPRGLFPAGNCRGARR